MKLLVSDYDGTLYTSSEDLLKNIEVIKSFRQKGNLFVVATGRAFNNFMIKVREYHIPFDYLILCNGTVIIDENLRLITKTTLDPNLIPSILKVMEKYQTEVTFIFDVWGENLKKINNQIVKLHFIVNDFSETDAIKKEITDLFPEVNIYISKSKYINIEIIAKETNKAKAIEFIIQKENINQDDVFVIGNAANDLEMIKEFNGAAMINSESEILNITQKHYESVFDLIKFGME